MSRMIRIVGSFMAVLAAYSAYAFIVVPLIEPDVALTRTASATEDDLNRASLAPQRQRAGFTNWFREGDWELTNPKVIEAGQARLLVKEYRNLGQGRLEIKPCTMIFLPKEGSADEEEWLRQAVILQAPGGAMLQFDRELDPGSGQFGNITSGRLDGPITIRSDQKSPGPEDDLFVETRDAVFSSDRITSPHPIHFRLGANHGEGVGLVIELQPESTGAEGDSVRAVQLEHQVQMYLDPTTSRKQFGESTTEESQAEAAPLATTENPSAADRLTDVGPITIQCQGPFRFDLQDRVATFNDQVDVVRTVIDGPSDTIHGELVAVHFVAVEQAADNASAATSTKLEPTLLEARGNPVIVRSPSSDVEARGQRMTYNLQTGEGSLEGRDPVFLRRGDSEIHAPALHFQPGPQGTWGTFSASGPGRLEGRLPESPDARIRADWQQQIHFGPQEGEQLLSVLGKAHIDMEGRGHLDGEAIYLWLRPEEGGATTSGEAPNRQRLAPDRLLAKGNVVFQFAELEGHVDELHAWFHMSADALQGRREIKQAAGDRKRIARTIYLASQRVEDQWRPSRAASDLGYTNAPTRTMPSAQHSTIPDDGRQNRIIRGAEPSGVAPDAVLRSPQTARQSTASPAEPVRPRFHVEGRLLECEVIERDGKTDLTALEIRDRVKLVERFTTKPGEEPLTLTGDRLEMLGTAEAGRTVQLWGQPASINARSMGLDGAHIDLDQRANRVTCHGAGTMTLPLDRDLDGQPLAGNEKLNVTWQGGMYFDGLQAHFDRGVVVWVGQRTMRTETMEVSMRQAVNLMQPSDDQRPEVDLIVCRGDVYGDSRTSQQGQLISLERFHAADLTIHAPTGDIKAAGPGWLKLIRYGTSAGLDDPLAAVGRPQSQTAQQGQKLDDDPGLTFVGVTFAGGMTGNLRQRQMTLHERVETIYGPVEAWEETIEREVFNNPNPPATLLKSATLTVVQLEQRGQRSVELEARGNATLEGRGITARAERMSYVEAKDQIVLEGTPRAKAELWRQVRPGAPQSHTSARKILFWRTTNEVEIDDAEMLDFNLLSNEGSSRDGGTDRR